MFQFIKRDFFKNVQIVFVGNLLAQVIPFIASFILAKMFLPEQFGDYALLFSIINPLSLITSLKYEIPIVLEKDNQNATQLFNTSIVINFIFFIVFLLISKFLLIFNPSIQQNSSLRFILQIVPYFLFVTGMFYPVQLVLQRQKAFTFLASGKIIQTSSIALLCLLFGYIGNYHGMIWGYFLGWIIYASSAWLLLSKTDFIPAKPDIKTMLALISKWKEYPLFHSIPTLLNTLALSIPIYILSSKFNQEQLGYYNLAKQILGIPAALLSSAVHQVIFQRITNSTSEGQFGIFKKTFFVLSAIALAMILSMVFFSEILFTSLYGMQWLNAGKMAVYLVFSSGLFFVVNALISVFAGINQIKIFSVWQFLHFISIFILVFIPFREVYTFIQILVLIESISYLILAGLMFYVFQSKSTNQTISQTQ